MDRKSIVAFVAIYALVAGVGFFASYRHNDAPTKTLPGAEETSSLIVEIDSPDRAASTVQ